MLALRPNCECCNRDLAAEAEDACICTFECTFCRDCTEEKLGGICPNCGGELLRRPRRPAAKLERYPASTERVFKPEGCAASTARASDEQAIRDLVARWMTASKAGDTATVLAMMTDDVIFLQPGHAPMRKDDFARAAQAQAAGQAPTFDGHSDMREVKILGDWAFMWTHLRVVATPPGSGTSSVREGHALSVLKKEDGRWKIARDANLLAPAKG